MSKQVRYSEDAVVHSVAAVHGIDFEEARVLVQHLRSRYPRAPKKFSLTPRPLSKTELVWLDQQLQRLAV